MIYALVIILLVLLAYGPHLWVKYVLWRHSTNINTMSGTGGELAQHLIERFKLDGVKVVEGIEGADHYNPSEKIVSLSPSVYQGKSITAISVATHEVGHAIQFVRKEPVSQLRDKYLGKAFIIKRIGSVIMLSIPIVTILIKIPHLILLSAIIGIGVNVCGHITRGIRCKL